MLSRGGGAVAFQKVVSKVSDLPSPLDAEPGMRIIVRETEEVYGLNSDTRMWEVIGTLKKVGGRKPEELAAHLDSKGNPHATSLQDVLSASTTAKIDTEIVITGKGAASQLRLLSGGSALRMGPAAGNTDGVLWMNVGSDKKTFLRAVNADGDDMMVLSTDGLVSGGSATFKSYKGLAKFEDEIVANEGVMSAPGYDLVLSGDKGVVLNVGGKPKVLIADNLTKLSTSLDVLGNLRLNGSVGSALIPDGELRLGDPKAPWSKAAVGDLDVANQVVIHVPANSTADPLKVVGNVPGDAVVLTAGGALGLGTDKPEARLDVRGNVLIDGGLSLIGAGLSCHDWSVRFADNLTISHKGVLALMVGAEGMVLSGRTKVEGDLVVVGKLAMSGISGLGDEEIAFSNGTATYKAKSHTFHGLARFAGDAVELPGAKLEGGNLKVEGAIYADSAALDGLMVGGMALKGNSLVTPDDFEIDAKTLVTKSLRLTGGQIETNVLKIKGHGGSAEFAFNGPNCGLDFEAKHFEMSGIDKLNAGSVSAEALAVKGNASLCDGSASFTKQGLKLDGGLSVGGMAFKRVVEELELSGASTATKFELDAGVRVEAVLVKLLSDVNGARFLQVGDSGDADRFASPFTDLKAGTLIRGLAHWDRGRAVQKTKGPIVVASDAPATGKVSVTVYYVDPAAF